MEPPARLIAMTRNFLFLLFLISLHALRADEASGFKKFAAATVHPLATQAAVAAYSKGGNAVDAAVAAGLTLGVVDGHNSGIGGGCFFVIHASDGTSLCIDGREMAPAKASRNMYVIDGRLDEEASKTGALASGVPGALGAYERALEKYGRLKLADLLIPAAELAEHGFEIDEVYQRKLAATAPKLQQFPGSRSIFLHSDGSPLKKGERLIQKDLAKTYRAIAANGTAWFYDGEYARKVDEWMRANGGVLEASDFANYSVKFRDPVRASYRGHEIVAMPPPSSGGIHVGQVLQMIERFPISALDDAHQIHLITEAMKLAFADRAHWLGDPDFVPVPRGLLDPSYTEHLSNQIKPDTTTSVSSHGFPPNWEGDVFGKHTTHVCTADIEGNWVSLNQTINTAFGSKVVIPETGVLLNNEMDDFSIQPGVPNAFRLIGAEANTIAPGKRPLSSMSPTIVFKDGRPILCTGAAGGPTIITQVILLISAVVDHRLPPVEALLRPRFHHQWAPDVLKVETNVGEKVLQELERLGHTLERSPGFGACQAILWDEQKQMFLPAHDPRVPGFSSGL